MSDRNHNYYVLDKARAYLEHAGTQVDEYRQLEPQDVRAGEFLDELKKLQTRLDNLIKDRHGKH